MKYKRMTEKAIGCFGYDLKDFEHKPKEFNDYDAFYAYKTAVGRLGELEDKIESRELVEVPKGAVVLTPEERAEEMRLANEERKQAVKDFSHKVLSVSKITFSTLTEPRIELSLAEYKQLVREACGE